MTTITWNFKSVKLATTPMMRLSSLRDQAVAHFQLEGDFGLRKTSSLAKKSFPFLDLNDTVRLANFSTGQKLELVKLSSQSGSVPKKEVVTNNKPANLVTVKLQVVSLPPSFSEKLEGLFSPSTTIGQMLEFFQHKSGISFDRKLKITEGDDTNVDLESMIRQGVYTVEFVDQESTKTTSTKTVKVFEPGKTMSNSAETDYEPTTAHAHAYVSTIRKQGTSHGLMTERLREQQKQARINQLGSVKVRLRFPDGVFVESQFSSSDTVHSLVETVQGVLKNEMKFRLWQSYPRKELVEESMRLMADLGFLTNTLVTVEFPDMAKFDSKQVLRSGVVVETPKVEETPVRNDSVKAEAKKKTGTPKWLKLGKK